MMLTYYFVVILRGIMKTKFFSWGFQKKKEKEKKTSNAFWTPYIYIYTIGKKTELTELTGNSALLLKVLSPAVPKWLLIHLQYVSIATGKVWGGISTDSLS